MATTISPASGSATAPALVPPQDSLAESTRTLIALLGAVVTSAQADLSDPAITRAQAAAARVASAQAQLAITLFRANLAPAPAAARARVLPGDTLYSIAQSYYGGNVFAYRQIVLANNLSSPIVLPGDILLLPAGP